MTTQPKTLSEVRDGLAAMYAEVMNDPRRCAQVHEGANALGKVVGACKVHLEACKLNKQTVTGDWASFITG